MSKAIDISKSKKINSKYGYSVPNNTNSKFLYELTLNYKEGGHFHHKELSDERYIKLVKTSDNVKYNKIDSYNVTITLVKEDNEDKYVLTGDLDCPMGFYSNEENNIYIEFTRLSNGNTECQCRYIDYNKFDLSISPPW